MSLLFVLNDLNNQIVYLSELKIIPLLPADGKVFFVKNIYFLKSLSLTFMI